MIKYVSMNLQDSKVGSGHRLFAVISEGRKWVKLLYIPSLTIVKIGIREFTAYAKISFITPNRLKKHLTKSRRTLKKHGLSYPKSVVKALIAACDK